MMVKIESHSLLVMVVAGMTYSMVLRMVWVLAIQTSFFGGWVFGSHMLCPLLDLLNQFLDLLNHVAIRCYPHSKKGLCCFMWLQALQGFRVLFEAYGLEFPWHVSYRAVSPVGARPGVVHKTPVGFDDVEFPSGGA